MNDQLQGCTAEDFLGLIEEQNVLGDDLMWQQEAEDRESSLEVCEQAYLSSWGNQDWS